MLSVDSCKWPVVRKYAAQLAACCLDISSLTFSYDGGEMIFDKNLLELEYSLHGGRGHLGLRVGV